MNMQELRLQIVRDFIARGLRLDTDEVERVATFVMYGSLGGVAAGSLGSKSAPKKVRRR
jgi:hypothetical protein